MKKISNALKSFVDKARVSDVYWVEAAKLHFAVGLDRQRVRAGLSYKDVAEKLGHSAAYVSKVFRGDSNVTIESMVKLARATGGRLDVKVVDDSAEAFSWEMAEFVRSIASKPINKPHAVSQPSSTVIHFPIAVNDDEFLRRFAA